MKHLKSKLIKWIKIAVFILPICDIDMEWIWSGYMDRIGNKPEMINRGLKRFSNCGKNINFSLLHNLQLNAKITAKHNSIMQHIDNVHPDQHISSLITILKALGSL